jgi:hypothetical protein
LPGVGIYTDCPLYLFVYTICPEDCLFTFTHHRGEMKTEHESLYDTERADIDMNEFREMVAKNAYYKAEKKRF